MTISQKKPIPFDLLHVLAAALYRAAAVGNLVYTLCVLPSMPHTVGYHFAADGTFDLFGARATAFVHPLVAEGLMLLLFGLLTMAAWRMRPVKRWSAASNRALTLSAVYLCDVLSIVVVAIMAHWTYCVANQTPMHTEFCRGMVWLAIASFAAQAVLMVVLAFHARVVARRN